MIRNKYMDMLKQPSDDKVELDDIDQFCTVANQVFEDIKESFGVNSYVDVMGVISGPKRRSVSPEQLCDYLQTACCLIERFAFPMLSKVVRESEDLVKDKLSLQDSVIKLQDKVIVTQDDYIKSVKTAVKDTVQAEINSVKTTVEDTVKSGIKSYANVVGKHCNAALSTKKIQSAVKKVSEIEERSKNLMVYGLPEVVGKLSSVKVKEMFTSIEEDRTIIKCERIGQVKEKSVRPIKVTLSSSYAVDNVLKSARNVRNLDGYGSVYVCPDRSLEERKAFKKLVEEVKQKRIDVPDKVHYIRHNKIISTDKKD